MGCEKRPESELRERSKETEEHSYLTDIPVEAAVRSINTLAFEASHPSPSKPFVFA